MMKRSLVNLVVTGTVLLILQSCITGYKFTSDTIAQMKTEKAIIVVKEAPKKKKKSGESNVSYAENNKIITNVLHKYWKYSIIVDEKNAINNREPLNSKSDYHSISVGTYEAMSYKKSDSYSPNSITIRNYSTGARVVMSSGKTIAFPVPFTAQPNFLNETSVTAAVKSLQELINQIETGIISSHREIYNNKKRDMSHLKYKTLLIPEFLYDEKFGIENMRALYGNRLEICSNEEYADIIEKGTPGYIVPLVSTDIISTSYAEHLSLWDSESWYCCAALLYKGFKNSNKHEFYRKNFDKKVMLDKKKWRLITRELNKYN